MTTRRGILALFGTTVATGPWREALFPGRYASEAMPYFDRPLVADPEPIEGELRVQVQQFRDGEWRAFSFPP